MKRKLKLVLVFMIFGLGITFAQKKITGTVISAEDGEPVIGASVMVKGSGVGTVTDFDGKFSLSVPEGTKKVTITYVGMLSEEFPVQDVMNVKLQTDAQSLQEVVVTGYQKIDRKLFTGSADKIKAEDAKIDGTTDVSHMLQGRTAGVSVQSVSGTFGAAPKMKVRGSSSIYGNQTPLWVVDGVILEDVVELSADALSSGDAITLIGSAVAGLNADDIESFQILKDASASALYGARAMNGVVVITTKRGKSGATSVNFSGEFGVRLKPLYSDYNIMNSQQQMDVYNELDMKGWMNYANVNNSSSSGIYGHMWSSVGQYNTSTGSFTLPVDDKRKYLQQAEFRNTDWFDELFRNTITQNYAVSTSSGSEKNRNYASLSVYNDPGWTAADKVQRFTGNFNSATDLSKTVTLTFLTMGSIRDQRAPGTQQQNVDPVSGEYSRDFDINPFSYALNTSRALDPDTYYKMNYAPFNIKNEIENNNMKITQMDLKLQADLSWKPIKGLEMNFLASYRYVKTKREEFINESSNLVKAYRAGTIYGDGGENANVAKRNPFLYSDPDNPTANPICVLPTGGIYSVQDLEMRNIFVRGSANYTKTFNEIHLTNFFLGAEVKSTDRWNSAFDGYGYSYKEALASTDYKLMKMMLENSYNYFMLSPTVDKSEAFFATASYSYLGKYTLNLTGRLDGSNQLGESADADWLPTWNVSGAWNAKEEAFMANNELFSDLRFRLTYGLNAIPAPMGSAMGIIRSENTYRPGGDNEVASYISSLPNYDLTWEKQYELDFGIDMGLFKNRLNLNFDVFARNSFDLVARVKVPGYGGKSSRIANYASLTNRGFEFSLGGKVIDMSAFKWNSNLTFAYVKNEITDLRSNPNVTTLVSAYGGDMQGYPTKSIFSLQFVGLSEEGLPQVIDENGNVSTTGVNFQESLKLDHLVYEGPVDAPYQGGFSNDFTYKSWRFNIFLTYQFGNVVRLDPTFSAQYSDLDVTPKEMKNRWVLPGDEKYTNIPAILSFDQFARNTDYTMGYNAYNYSTERIAKGDYIRLRDIFVSYDLPKSVLTSLKLNNAQLKLSASNLGLLYADKKLNGQDPEFLRSGGVAMPNPRQFTLTLRVGL